jgi:hypothetical protein
MVAFLPSRNTLTMLLLLGALAAESALELVLARVSKVMFSRVKVRFPAKTAGKSEDFTREVSFL